MAWDWYDKEISINAEVYGQKLPVHNVIGVEAHPEDNSYLLITLEGGLISTSYNEDRDVYFVEVYEYLRPPRFYDSTETPHARVVFWNAMAFTYELWEKKAKEKQ